MKSSMSQVVVDENVRTLPYALVTPGEYLNEDCILTTHGGRTTNSKELSEQLKAWASVNIETSHLSLLQATIAQVGSVNSP